MVRAEYLDGCVVRENGCLGYEGKAQVHGYPVVTIDRKPTKLHNVLYEQFVGPIPAKHDLHHTCEDRSCVNPFHGEALTRKEHIARHPQQRTHCSRGHEFTGANTYIRANGDRRCRKCHAIRERGYRAGLTAVLAVVVALLVASPVGADRISEQQARARPVICKVFGSACSEALAVSWCESKWYVWASNGEYKGLFQMGSSERRRYGHGPGAWAQSRAAYRYYVESGRDWSPWSCRWAID